jgi:hypothetical protein
MEISRWSYEENYQRTVKQRHRKWGIDKVTWTNGPIDFRIYENKGFGELMILSPND